MTRLSIPLSRGQTSVRLAPRVKTEKHADGLWHVIELSGRALCGRAREPQRQGRPAVRPSCPVCTAAVETAVVPIDPPVREDGRCATCGKPRKPERSRRYGGDEADRDPFCSSVCCRRWHGLELHQDDEPEEVAA